ncbi:MAG: LPS export ABC transporter periplasmic protein LptC [Bacteroidetes bacterium GWF2_49_14]|nr:MAG: LPS export ABC transporter periplasmic protein LptC [Bacteroidetes bacterium GWF2_49_14]HBB92020.1 LPS export ABC transporter periplasmic protein LptC [Bacteroidales bacterium]
MLHLKTIRVIPLIGGMTLLFSCGSGIERVSRIENPDTLPAIHATGIEIIYSDSSIVRLTIKAPELKDFVQADTLEPKSEFPKGLTATFYNQGGGVESILSAGYAIYHIKKKTFEATGDVVIKNFSENQELHTEVLWWDELHEKIWSDQPFSITTPDGTTHGKNGFEADQSFRKYRLRGTSGQMKVKETDDGGQTTDDGGL